MMFIDTPSIPSMIGGGRQERQQLATVVTSCQVAEVGRTRLKVGRTRFDQNLRSGGFAPPPKNSFHNSSSSINEANESFTRRLARSFASLVSSPGDIVPVPDDGDDDADASKESTTPFNKFGSAYRRTMESSIEDDRFSTS